MIRLKTIFQKHILTQQYERHRSSVKRTVLHHRSQVTWGFPGLFLVLWPNYMGFLLCLDSVFIQNPILFHLRHFLYYTQARRPWCRRRWGRSDAGPSSSAWSRTDAWRGTSSPSPRWPPPGSTVRANVWTTRAVCPSTTSPTDYARLTPRINPRTARITSVLPGLRIMEKTSAW